MDIFSEVANRFDNLDKQIFEFLRSIPPCIADFENLAGKQQQELISTIAEKGDAFCDQVLAVYWGQDGEKAIFELRNANKTDLANDRRSGRRKTNIPAIMQPLP